MQTFRKKTGNQKLLLEIWYNAPIAGLIALHPNHTIAIVKDKIAECAGTRFMTFNSERNNSLVVND